MEKEFKVIRTSNWGYKLCKIVLVVLAVLMTLALLLSLGGLAKDINSAEMGLVAVFGYVTIFGGGLLFAIGIIISIYALCGLRELDKLDWAIVKARFFSLLIALVFAVGATVYVFLNSGIPTLISALIWVGGIDFGAVLILVIPRLTCKTMAKI